MALYDDPYASPDLVAQDAALARRRARILEEVRQSAQRAGVYAPAQADNQEVGGFTLSTGQRMPGRIVGGAGAALQALAPLAAQYSLNQREADLTREEAQFNQATREDATRRYAAMPQGTPATPDTVIPPLTPNDDEGNAMPHAIKAGTPAQDAPLADIVKWAASLQENPRTAGIGGEVLKNQLVTLPGKRVEQLIEMLKLDETRKHNRAMENKSAVTSPQYNSVFDAAGAPTGVFDTRSGVYYDMQGRAQNPRPGMTMSAPGSNERVPVPTTAPAGNQGGVRGPGTGEDRKQQIEMETKLRNIDTATSLVNKAFPLLEKSRSGGEGIATEAWERMTGKKGGVAQSHLLLDQLAETLKPFYDRPPGDPTASEVKAWGTAMAGLNDRTQHPADRAAAAVQLLNQMAEQKARLTGQPAPPPIEVPAWARTEAKPPSVKDTMDATGAKDVLVREQGLKDAQAAYREAKARHGANPTPANKRALDEAEANVLRSQASGTKPKFKILSIER